MGANQYTMKGINPVRLTGSRTFAGVRITISPGLEVLILHQLLSAAETRGENLQEICVKTKYNIISTVARWRQVAGLKPVAAARPPLASKTTIQLPQKNIRGLSLLLVDALLSQSNSLFFFHIPLPCS